MRGESGYGTEHTRHGHGGFLLHETLDDVFPLLLWPTVLQKCRDDGWEPSRRRIVGPAACVLYIGTFRTGDFATLFLWSSSESRPFLDEEWTGGLGGSSALKRFHRGHEMIMMTFERQLA